MCLKIYENDCNSLDSYEDELHEDEILYNYGDRCHCTFVRNIK